VLTLVFGLLILFAGGLNIYTITIGLGISGFSFFELPAVRLFFELKINKVTGTNVFTISDSDISNSSFIGNVQGNVIMGGRDDSKKQPAPWPIQRNFSIATDEHKSIRLEMKKGERLEGKVEGDGQFDVYLMTRSSLRNFEDGGNPNSLWLEEGVELTTLDYENDRAREVYLVVSNEYDEENDGEPVSVEVRLRISKES